MSGGPNDGAPEPVDPISEGLAGAIALRALFVNYIEAGFSEYQVCVMLGTALAQGARGNEES